MASFNQQDLLAYGWAVGVYWVAIMGILFVIAGDGADWFVPNLKSRINKIIPAEPRRKIEVFLMIAAILLAGFEAWQAEKEKYDTAEMRRARSQEWLAKWTGRADDRWTAIHSPDGYLAQIKRLQNAAAPIPKHVGLKRLIAYDNPLVLQATIPKDGKNTFVFQGFGFRLNNASSDTIKMKLDFVRASLDGKEVMNGCAIHWSIVAQTQGMAPQCRIIPDGIVLPSNAKEITLEFEVSYDTIPPTGVRKSYRKLAYSATWDNGLNNPPTIQIDHVDSEKEN